MSERVVPSKGSNTFSRRHEMHQINIYYIKTLVLAGFFFNKTSKGERKALFWPPVSHGSHKPFHSVGVSMKKCSGQRHGINILIPCQTGSAEGFSGTGIATQASFSSPGLFKLCPLMPKKHLFVQLYTIGIQIKFLSIINNTFK